MNTPSSPIRSTRTLRSHLARESMLIILIVMCIALSYFEPSFRTTTNLLNVLRQVSIIGVIAFGMTMVIISAEIDLSVGSAAALAGCLVAVIIDKCGDKGVSLSVSLPLAVLTTLAAGFAMGVFTAAMRNLFRVPCFISTLALLTGLRGTAQYITDGFPVNLPPVITFLGSGDILGVPVPALIFLVVFVSVHFLMNYTTFGRSVYAVGGNAEAARLSGIDVWRIRVWVLAINGMLAYLAGILLAARIGSGIPTAALGMELDVIAAVIIGGTSLFGGSGRVWGTLVGLLFIGVIRNGMTLLNIQHDVQLIVRGGLILIAVWINQTTLKYSSERSR